MIILFMWTVNGLRESQSEEEGMGIIRYSEAAGGD